MPDGFERRLWIGAVCLGVAVAGCYPSGPDDGQWYGDNTDPSAGQTGPEVCGNDLDDNGDGTVDEGCPCASDAIRPCFRGPAESLTVGVCHAGTQTCERASGDNEFNGRWGACVGEVAPSPEKCSDQLDNDCDGQVDCADPDCAAAPACAATCTPYPEICSDGTDNDCDGQVDCADPDCAAAPICIQQKCSGGYVKINNLWYWFDPGCVTGVPAYGVKCCSFGTGGTLTANCAGTYTVCAAVKNRKTNQVCHESCVTVHAANDGATVNLPPFPSFKQCNPCAAAAANWDGTRTCLRVSGTTQQGVKVSKEVFCGWDACTPNNMAGCYGPGGGPGGGGF